MIIYIISYLARFFKGIDDFLAKSFPIKNTSLVVTENLLRFSFVLISRKRLHIVLLHAILI